VWGAWPTPIRPRVPPKVTSLDHRAAKRATNCPADVVRAVEIKCQVVARVCGGRLGRCAEPPALQAGGAWPTGVGATPITTT
jgi:hypothetical protein